MIKVVSVEQMRRIEAAADASGLSYDQMMQNAGSAVAQRVLQIIAGRTDARVTVLVGWGNNGGDGLVAGRLIAEHGGGQVRFYLLRQRDDSDANFKAVRDADLFIAYAEHDRDFRVLRNMVASADVVIDALFGIGVRLPLKPEIAHVLRNVAQALHSHSQPERPEGDIISPAEPVPSPRFRPYVVAVDCPSGLNCDSGEQDASTVPADETVTFIAAKPGLFNFPGAAAVGQLHVATIGVSADLPELKSEQRTVLDGETVRSLLPARVANANKGTFGKALILGGSMNYTGAPGLAALAAYRVGAGLVTVGAPTPVVDTLNGHLLEPTWLPLPAKEGALAGEAVSLVCEVSDQYDALLLGPGWGRAQGTQAFLLQLLESFGQAQAETHNPDVKLPSLVVDADGLNLLSERDQWWTLLPGNAIITPHPGEMGRLARLSTKDVLANRWEIAVSKAAEWNVVLVLKGAHTLIAAPDGRVCVLPFKTDALATAGTGDVLAGMITGFLAQGMLPFDAARVAGYLHGLAGVIAAKRPANSRTIIASDILASLAAAFNTVEAS